MLRCRAQYTILLCIIIRTINPCNNIALTFYTCFFHDILDLFIIIRRYETESRRNGGANMQKTNYEKYCGKSSNEYMYVETIYLLDVHFNALLAIYLIAPFTDSPFMRGVHLCAGACILR